MLARRIALAALTVTLLGLALASCSDEDGQSLFKGTITDTDGEPLEGAAILISFAPSFADLLQPFALAETDKDLPPSTLQSLVILDPCDNVVRSLCDGDCEGMQVISWDGLDDDGMKAVEGLYYFEAAFEDTLMRQEMILIHFYPGWNIEEGNYHALTDAKGQFSLDDKCLGFGTEITTTDEEGNVIDTRPIQRSINVRIVAPDGRFVERDSLWWPEGSGVTLNYQFQTR